MKLIFNTTQQLFSENLFYYARFERDEHFSEENNKVIDYIVSNTDRTVDGRLIMSLPICHGMHSESIYWAKIII